MKKPPQKPEPARRRGKPQKDAPPRDHSEPVPRKHVRTRPPSGKRRLPASKSRTAGSDGLPRWWAPYMREIELNGGFTNVAKESIGISNSTPEMYIIKHPDLKPRFDAEVEAARQRATERILAEGVRRGVKGYEEPVYYQGERTDTITKYSDTLLIFSANARGVGTREPAQVRINLDLNEMREMPADLLQRLVDGDNPAEVVAAWRARQEAEKILGELPQKD